MNHLARLSSLVVALSIGLPSAVLAHDHHDDHGRSCYRGGWHGRYYGPSFGIFPPVFANYGYPYYGGYYDYAPSFGVSISTSSTPTYRGARVEDRGDALSIDVQRALRHDGYYRGEVDGDIGAGTRAAIRQYQYDHRLEVTGRIDRALLRSLGLD